MDTLSSDIVKNTYVLNTIQKIKFEDSIENKILMAKTLLTNTDIIKSENALCQFENETWYHEENSLNKFLEYKKKSSSFYRGVDCDASILCIVMYVLLSDELELNNIVYQDNNKQKYELQSSIGKFRGDTLTSALHSLKLYLGSLWKRIDNNPLLQKQDRYRQFYNLFNEIATTGIPKVPQENTDWISYCHQNCDIIWNAMDIKAKNFLKNYNMFGNYMCIPGNTYQISQNRSTSFNTARSNYGEWDTVDTLLIKIYAYYQYSNDTYLKSIFTNKKDELTKETLNWLENFKDWSDFINKNALQPFVDKTTLTPICLKTGNPIKANEIENYDAIPKNYDEFLLFFKEVSERIKARNECIFDKIFSNPK
ncbi:MAG: hypothetical protein E7542_05935 [Ruminococcaceae bacterium]|nr:hypothetical protein [Oscillospiraceae bacterium]